MIRTVSQIIEINRQVDSGKVQLKSKRVYFTLQRSMN